MLLVDSNILIDLFTDDPGWADWSAQALQRAAEQYQPAINPIIYAELAPAFQSRERLDQALAPLQFHFSTLPYAAGFLAARAYLRYRKKGGDRRSPLPDFYIGAHAASKNLPLLTRDPKRYRTYFPQVQLITP